MYQLPELYRTKNYSVEVRTEEVRLFKEQSLIIKNDICCDKHVHELCKILMDEYNYSAPKNVHHALDLYINLRQNIYELI